MNARFVCLLRAVLLSLALVPTIGTTATGHDVTFNASVDFRALKTFAIRTGQISSSKPEIDNRLFRQRMEDSIRATLVKKGFAQATGQPDVSVTYSFQDKDVSRVERQGAVRMPDSGVVIPAAGPSPVLYTEGTLVVDFTDASGALLWRGTWRVQESSGPTLSRKLSEDVRKLLADFPPKRRRN